MNVSVGTSPAYKDPCAGRRTKQQLGIINYIRMPKPTILLELTKTLPEEEAPGYNYLPSLRNHYYGLVLARQLLSITQTMNFLLILKVE